MAESKKSNKDFLDTPEMHIQDQKHAINTELIGIIKFRQNKKWLISIAVVSLFSAILGLMIWFMSSGVDVMGGWKEILLLMLGGFVGSFAKVIDFWFNNAEDDVKLLEHADD
jgi:RsiW-degrading membrane proteinase PrsW (M82 family)|tara:strand:- start:3 stop:338 length:336 start_codon:yes stop_codon:yes gene_type:complete